MKNKALWIILTTLVFGLAVTGNALAVQPNGYGSVLDNNNGSQGQVLVNTGQDNGNSDIGTWVDSSFLKGDKGDKGDTGASGQDGKDGIDGKNGVDGKDGVDGTDGQNGSDGQDGAEGKQGKQGKQGNKGERGERGKGLKDSYELQLEGVLKETRKTATSVYYIRDFNNQHNTVGLKVKYYFGKSYSEQVREDLQRQIDELKELKQSTTNYVDRDGVEVVPIGENGWGIEKRIDL